ncbi:MAG: EpsG family protein [Prevotella sp.]|nr:EpsG family protein [Prevotella sp.]
MQAVFTFAAIYMSLRYNYPSDYPAYQGAFYQYSNPGYVYDPDTDHMEYGWFLLNRLFAPLGYYVFVAFCSCIFAYGLYVITEAIVPKVYLPLVVLGLFVMGSFEILMSAQRQLLVTGIFLIAYRWLIYQRINGLKSLFKIRTLLYFAIIFMCLFFHKSALFLMFIPFLYVLPSKSPAVMLGLAVAAVFLLLYGNLYLVDFFEQLQEESGEYSYMVFTGEYSGTVSFLQASMWIFQFICVSHVYLKYSYDNNEKAIMLISMLSILIIISGYSLGQIARLTHFIYMFSFMVFAIIAQKLKGRSFQKTYILVNWAWVIWNAMKVFSIPRGTLYEYKLLLFNL